MKIGIFTALFGDKTRAETLEIVKAEGMHGEGEHAPSERRDTSTAIERAERIEQVTALRKCARRRRIWRWRSF